VIGGALLVVASAAAALASEGFEPVAVERGISIYRRPGAIGIELAAEGDFAAPPERVQAVLIDYAHHTRWVAHLAESRVLDSGPDWLDVYQRLSLPIISDRDYTLHVTWGRDGEALWLRFAATERGPAPRSGVVRVRVHEGSWRLLPRDGGRATHAIYRFHLDLAGSLPGWMGRGRARQDVPALFEGVARQL
jgi:hypothetical protein